jgi:hypothetical protein
MPDLIALKRTAESIVGSGETDAVTDEKDPKRQKTVTPIIEDRLFLARLPLTVNKTKLAEALDDEIEVVHWLTDQRTGAFYGSCMVQLSSGNAAKVAVGKSIKLDKKKIKISFVRAKDGEQWPPMDYKEREFPPVGC